MIDTFPLLFAGFASVRRYPFAWPDRIAGIAARVPAHVARSCAESHATCNGNRGVPLFAVRNL
jgi:hypothetical protein